MVLHSVDTPTTQHVDRLELRYAVHQSVKPLSATDRFNCLISEAFKRLKMVCKAHWGLSTVKVAPMHYLTLTPTTPKPTNSVAATDCQLALPGRHPLSEAAANGRRTVVTDCNNRQRQHCNKFLFTTHYHAQKEIIKLLNSKRPPVCELWCFAADEWSNTPAQWLVTWPPESILQHLQCGWPQFL